MCVCCGCRQKSGIWGFRSDKVEDVNGYQAKVSQQPETMDYSPWFSARIGNFPFRQKRISLERASQEQQNGTNFSFVAPFIEEL